MVLGDGSMKKVIMNRCMELVRKYNTDKTENDFEIIQYGLEGLYLTVSKLIVIILPSIIFGIWKEVIIFLLIYNIIRTPSFGLHATKSWICLLSSTCIFIGVPFLCTQLVIPAEIKMTIGIICILFMFKNAPADTYKRPIVSKKRRLTYKLISTAVAIAMVIVAMVIEDQFISNSLLLALVVQNFMISPIVYHIFKLPYANYKHYVVDVA